MNTIGTRNKLQDWSLALVDFFGSRLFLFASYSWFVLQAGYIAVTTNYRIAPDAFAHLSLIKLYVRDGIDPFIQNQEGFYFIWEATRHPSTLYHYLFSFVYRISPFSEDGTVLLIRLLNVLIGLASLIVFYHLMKKLRISKAARGISIFMLVNTMMFVFLSGSINYDNAAILFTTLTFYVLVLFLQKVSILRLASLVLVCMVALLTKYSLAPLIAACALVAVYYAWKGQRELRSELRRFQDSSTWRSPWVALLTVSLVIFGFMFVNRYVVNIVEYGAIKPSCVSVHTLKECRNSALFRRNENLKAKEATYELSVTQFPAEWAQRMSETTFAVFGHKSYRQTDVTKLTTTLLVIVTLIAVAVGLARRSGPKELNVLLAISIFYVIILLFVNYKSYLKYGEFGLALQGRYALPVLPVLYMAGNQYVFKLFKNLSLVRALYLLIFSSLFLLSGAASFMVKTSPEWYSDTSVFRDHVRHHLDRIDNKVHIF